MITPKAPSTALEAFKRDGFYVARGLLTSEEVDHIRDAFMAANADGPVAGLSDIVTQDRADPLAFYPRMMHPHRHPDLPIGQLAERYLLDPRLHSFLQTFLGEEPIAVQTMFYFKPPKARGQELHQDNFYLRVKPGTCMAAWIAIDDADAENGGMVVVPGSQNMEIVCPSQADTRTSFTTDYVPVPEGKTVLQTELNAGDVLFFNGSLIHGSTPNSSDVRFRRSLICHYVPEGSVEVGHWYRDRMLRFDGTTVDIPEAAGGGPCGTAQPSGPH